MGESNTASSQKGSSSGLGGFFSRLFSFFSNRNDPDWERKRLLRDIGKALKKTKYKFYNPRTEQALPGLAKYFHEIYKVIGPAQVLLTPEEVSGIVKTAIIEKEFPDMILDLKTAFSEEGIRNRADTTDTKSLQKHLKDGLVTFISFFDNEKVKRINSTYNLLSIFMDFTNFDYFFMLKKFDSSLHERDFIYNPRFDSINGEYISEDLKEFLSLAYTLDRDSDWNRLFDLLRVYKNMDIVGVNNWKKIQRSLDDIKRSKIFEMIIQHTDKDPFYKVQVFTPNENVVEEYINKIKTQVEVNLQKVLKEKRTRKIDDLLHNVFGTTAVIRLKHYSDKANMTFAKKMLGGYIYVAPLNYLKAFFLDYYKKDIRELVDLLLVRGKWTTNIMSQQLSEAFHRLMELSDELIKFDASLADDGERGSAIKNHLKRAERDKNSASILRKSLKDTNDTALHLIQESAQNLIVVGKNLKNLLEDFKKMPHELLVNWKEIATTTDNRIEKMITHVYKQIYYFIQLLQFYLKKTEE